MAVAEETMSQSRVVIIVSIIAAIILGVFISCGSTVTDFIYH
ncbi:MAG: hypothetical protein R3A47_04370 [Polyangiales bacterium]